MQMAKMHIVERWYSEVRRDNKELQNERSPRTPCRCETNACIRLTLQEDPSALLLTIGKILSISRETIRPDMSRIGHILKQTRPTTYLHLVPRLRIHTHNN
jgi:hypothetical protein